MHSYATKLPGANLSFIDHFCCIFTSAGKDDVHESNADKKSCCYLS